eukprot:TRINITY_DN66429_c5_g1_i2.p1 TRINITY_DN66429_c5_g1~~TRINITY_DN66429_c5_g1_i2.p1  ORF type:complete len:658 (+),score=44.82 TRINITY_DN66429_c5_g1_i2:56-2029(+)
MPYHFLVPLLLVGCLSTLGTAKPSHFNQILNAVNLSDTRLLEGTWQYKQQRTSLECMLSLEPDRLLYNFRHQAGLPQAPGAKPYGGWEAPTCQLRGHFVGHYMSATSFMYASTGNETVKNNMDYLVRELSKCQQKMGTGFLAAFPVSFFDKLEHHIYVWAPYYTIHKIMAGLYDQYRIAGNTLALEMASWMAEYFYDRTVKVLASQGMKGWQEILGNEWGGMNEVLYNLYGATGDPRQLAFGNLFDHYSWSRPLAADMDDLSPHHANTHIPEMIGYQRGYEVNNNKTQQYMANNFIRFIAANHSWATGGSNTYEFWHTPANMGTQLALWTEESCTQYNILKVLRHAFLQTGEISYFDWYERGITNGIIGNLRWNHPGEMIYMLPMGGGGTHKGNNTYYGPSGYEHEKYKINWGTPYNSFWCCYGTLFESFSKLTDSIYFLSPDSDTLYINQYMGSSYQWPKQQVGVQWKVSNLTKSLSAVLSFNAPHPTWNKEFTLKIRVPHWVQPGSQGRVNNEPAVSLQPQQYYTLKRKWTAKDTVTIHLNPSVWVQPIRDDRPQWKKTFALMYAHVIIVGVTPPPHNTTKLEIAPEHVQEYIKIDAEPTQPLATVTFTLTPPKGNPITLMPFYQCMDQPYTVYWNQGPLMPPPELAEHAWGTDL